MAEGAGKTSKKGSNKTKKSKALRELEEQNEKVLQRLNLFVEEYSMKIPILYKVLIFDIEPWDPQPSMLIRATLLDLNTLKTLVNLSQSVVRS